MELVHTTVILEVCQRRRGLLTEKRRYCGMVLTCHKITQKEGMQGDVAAVSYSVTFLRHFNLKVYFKPF